MRRTSVVDRSVNCVDVKEARLRGAPLSPEAAGHARECPICSANADEGQGTTSELDELFRGIETKLGRERGVLAWARSRSTTTRLLVAACSIAALVVLSAVGIPRTRFAPIPTERVVVVLGALSVLAAILLRVGLRPAQTPAPPDRSLLMIVAAGLLLPVATAFLLGGAHPFHHYV